MKITRNAVLNEIINKFGSNSWTTADLAQAMGVKERQIIGAVGWLRAGGVVKRDGSEMRRLPTLQKYMVHQYRWCGVRTVRSVAQKEQDRLQYDLGTVLGVLRRWGRS